MLEFFGSQGAVLATTGEAAGMMSASVWTPMPQAARAEATST